MNIVRGPPQTVGISVAVAVAVGVGVNVEVGDGVNVYVDVAEAVGTADGASPLIAAQPRMKSGRKKDMKIT